VIEWDAASIATAAGARLVSSGREGTAVASGGEREDGLGAQPEQAPGPRSKPAPGPRRVTIDSRGVRAGDLFVGLPGERVDGGSYAEQALRAGAWGVLVTPAHAARISTGADRPGGAVLTHPDSPERAVLVHSDPPERAVLAHAGPPDGAILAHPDPLAGLQALARAWRRALGAKVVGITGSTGKTSTKDILAALLARELRTAASPENLNTEIGLPLAVLAAPRGTEALVLEMAMRGPGQIAELVAIAEPDVGVIVNVGPVHLELLGSLEAIAAAKAELIAGLAPGATVVLPAGEPLLAPHLRADLRTVTFGVGGDVELLRGPANGEDGDAGPVADSRRGRDVGFAPSRGDAGPVADSRGGSDVGFAPSRGDGEVTIVDHVRGGAEAERLIAVKPSFAQSHNLLNLLAAVAAARALGVTPGGKLEVAFSALRGERIALADGIVLINDCYNANPMSMRAALDDLAASAPARRVAVLGDMLELGREGPGLHREVAAHASARGVELLVAVGPLAAELTEAFPGEAHRVPDAAAAAELLRGLLRPADTVLVKGSRGVGLERVAEMLVAATGLAAPAAPTATGSSPGPATPMATDSTAGLAGADRRPGGTR
jgi:UDP-N-acetylmuramoyl-tripeptide--D-alanyl-D-alanine ligase